MDRKYFSKFEEIKPLEVLNSFDNTRSILLIALDVYPLSGLTGMREERHDWLHQFWDKALSISDEIGGCRLSWTQAFFATYETNQAEVVSGFQTILQQMKNPNLQSFCIFGVVSGTTDDRIKMLDAMHHELSGKKDFGSGNQEFIRLIDGKLIGS